MKRIQICLACLTILGILNVNDIKCAPEINQLTERSMSWINRFNQKIVNPYNWNANVNLKMFAMPFNMHCQTPQFHDSSYQKYLLRIITEKKNMSPETARKYAANIIQRYLIDPAFLKENILTINTLILKNYDKVQDSILVIQYLETLSKHLIYNTLDREATIAIVQTFSTFHNNSYNSLLRNLLAESIKTDSVLSAALIVNLAMLGDAESENTIKEVFKTTENEFIFQASGYALCLYNCNDIINILNNHGHRFGDKYISFFVNKMRERILQEINTSKAKDLQVSIIALTRYLYKNEDNSKIKKIFIEALTKEVDTPIKKEILNVLRSKLSHKEAIQISALLGADNLLKDELDWIAGYANASPIPFNEGSTTKRDALSQEAQLFGNPIEQEYGDAVYNDNFFQLAGVGFAYLGHAGLFAGLTEQGQKRIIQVRSDIPLVGDDEFSGMFNDDYWGSYTIDPTYRLMSFGDRSDVIFTARELSFMIGITYPLFPYIGWTQLSHNPACGIKIDPSEVWELRCDGLVEYCYEFNGINVWGQFGQNYDISNPNYADYHDGLFTNCLWGDPCNNVAPIVQCGGNDGCGENTCTFLNTASIIDYPSYETYISYNGLSQNLYIKATDKSGIHYIKYKIGQTGNWQFSPIQPQHPLQDYYTININLNLSAPETVFFSAMDNGGNEPPVPASVLIDVQPASLSNGTVSPVSGNTSTPFTFTVTFSDLTNNPPQNVKLICDGTQYSMTGSGTNYQSGVPYTKVLTFSTNGTRQFHFEAISATGTALRYPFSGELYLPVNPGGISAYPPTIEITNPNNEVVHDICYIWWNDNDPDNNAIIYLYYDNNNSGQNGTCMNPGNPVFEDNSDGYSWNTVNMPEGQYWIYATIDDGTTINYDYSPGYVEINHPDLSANFQYMSKQAEEDEGDGDMIIESGESFELDVWIKNQSSSLEMHDVESILTTTNPNVTITDNDSYYGIFQPLQNKKGNDDFGIQVANGFSGYVAFQLNLTFVDENGYMFYQVLNIPNIHISDNVSPAFEVVGNPVITDDGSKCNNDGILQSGENSIDFLLSLMNTGSGDAIDVEALCFLPAMFNGTTTYWADYPDIDVGDSEWPLPGEDFNIQQIPYDFVGNIQGQLTVYWASQDFNQAVPFQLQVFPAPRLNYSPEGTDFGIEEPGDTAVIPITIWNYGSSDLIISQIENIPGNPGNIISGVNFPLTICPACTVNISISITRDTPMNVNETFRIHSNNHNRGTHDIQVSGTFFNQSTESYIQVWTSDPALNQGGDWVEPADLDNDGLVDIVTFYDNILYIWEQTTTGSFQFTLKFSYTFQIGNQVYIESCKVGNCDGDIYMDIAIGVYVQDNFSSKLFVFENTGNDQYAQVWQLSNAPGYDKLEVGNCNNDTNDEIVLFNDSKVTIYKRSANNSYTSVWNSGTTIQDYGAGGTNMGYVGIGDSDQDGKKEIIVAGADEWVFIWENTSGSSYSLIHDPFISYSPDPELEKVFPIIIDIDNDNIKEIIFSGEENGFEFSVFNPSTWSFEFHNSPGLYGEFSSPAVADLNSNGFMEVFLGEDYQGSRMIVYEYSNGSYFEVFASEPFIDHIYNIEAVDLNNDGVSELIISQDDHFQIWKYEVPPVLPDLEVAANNLSFTPENPTDNDVVNISMLVRNMGNATAGEIAVEFYLSDPSEGNLIDSLTIPVIEEGADSLITLNLVFSQTGQYNLYVIVDRNDSIEESDETNNICFKPIIITDNDEQPPIILSNTHEEFTGDNDGLIEDNEAIRFDWQVTDDSGIGNTYLMFDNDSVIEGIQESEGHYYCILSPRPTGFFPYEIHATDNDNSPQSIEKFDTVLVIQHAPHVISVYPADNATNISTGDTIVAAFDIPINASSINSNSVLLLKNGITVVMPLSLTYYPASQRLVFDPGMLEPGTLYEMLILAGNSGVRDLNNNTLDSNYSWSFNTVTYPVVALSPSYLNFGDIPVGTCSAIQEFILSNTGTLPASGSVELSGPDTTAFQIVSGGGNFILNPGDQQSISVQFCPNTSGIKSVILSGTLQGTGNNVFTLLEGTGTDPSPESIITYFSLSQACEGNLNVPIVIQNAIDVAAISLTILFSPDILTYQGYQQVHPSLSNGILEVNQDSNNIILAWFSLLPFSISNDTLIQLNFTASAGYSSLTWDLLTPEACQYVDIDDQIIPSIFQNQTVTVEYCNNINGQLTYNNTTNTPIGNAMILLEQNNTVISQTLTDAGGSYQFQNMPDGTYALDGQCLKPWGGANSADALIVMKHFTGLSLLTGIRLKAADVNISGTVNSVDALMIAKRFTQQLSSFPAGDWAFESPVVVLNGNNIVQNIMTLCYGDVNGSYAPAAKITPMVNIEENSTIVVRGRENIILPLLSGQEAEIGSVSLVINVSSELLLCHDVTTELGGVLDFHQSNDQIRIAWYNIAPALVQPGDVLLSLHFSLLHDFTSPLFATGPESNITDSEAKSYETFCLFHSKILFTGNENNEVCVFPNPFSNETELHYFLDEDASVTLNLFSVTGQLLRTYFYDRQTRGNNKIIVNSLEAGPGIYFFEYIVNSRNKSSITDGKIIQIR